MPGTNPLSPLPNVPHEDQYTVQTSLAVLKTNLPPSYFTPHLAIITDGKAVGEAIRMTGAQMVYVRFPVNETGYPVSFSIPKAFLIPLTVRPLVKPLAGTVQLGGSYSSPVPGAIGGSSFAGVGGSSFANHAHVDLGFHLGEKGEPALCVVCGRWDVEETGKKRSSGHKCKSCIGQKSLERLRKEFERLIDSADVPIPQEDFLRLVDDPNQLPSYDKGGAPPSPHMGPMGGAASAASPQQSPEATLQDDVLET